MTEANVKQLIKDAELRGREVSRFDAKAYLGAREALVKDPKNEIAEKVVEEFVKFIATGEWPLHQGGRSFAPFILPEFQTEEERCLTQSRASTGAPSAEKTGHTA
jgi:hypothetical protein